MANFASGYPSGEDALLLFNQIKKEAEYDFKTSAGARHRIIPTNPGRFACLWRENLPESLGAGLDEDRENRKVLHPEGVL